MIRPARRHPHTRLVRLAVALAAISACASAAALDIQLPSETATLHPGTRWPLATRAPSARLVMKLRTL